MITTSPVFCDLHAHTHFSDGSFSPEDLVTLATEKGLGAVALTDHNTVSGLPSFLKAIEAHRAAGKVPPIPVPGVELSTEYITVTGREVELHILALFLPEEEFITMAAFTSDYAYRKKQSTRQMVESLCADGYLLDYDAIRAATPNGNINRAHVAAALMQAGYVSTITEAFDTLLTMGGKYYTPPRRPTAIETIAFVTSLGAVAVLAHPYLNITPEELEAFLPEAKAHGLCGMETRYVTYDEATTALATATAARFGLLESGGSDFHGTNKPGIDLGVGRGGLQVPFSFYQGLAAVAAKPTGV